MAKIGNTDYIEELIFKKTCIYNDYNINKIIKYKTDVNEYIKIKDIFSYFDKNYENWLYTNSTLNIIDNIKPLIQNTIRMFTIDSPPIFICEEYTNNNIYIHPYGAICCALYLDLHFAIAIILQLYDYIIAYGEEKDIFKIIKIYKIYTQDEFLYKKFKNTIKESIFQHNENEDFNATELYNDYLEKNRVIYCPKWM